MKQKGTGVIVAEYLVMDDATAKLFVLGLDTMGTELKFSHKVEAAARGALESAEKVLDKYKLGWAARWIANGLALFGAFSAPLYFLWALATVYVYAMGWFAPEGWWLAPETITGQVLYILGASISSLFWVLPWYAADALTKILGAWVGKIGSFGHTARSIGALLFGFGGILSLVKIVMWLLDWDSPMVDVTMGIAFLAVLGYDRQVARWTDSESIKHLSETVAHNQAIALSALFSVAIALAALVGYVETARDGTVFRLVIATETVNGTPVHYIPLPNGNVYRPEEILGRTVAEQVVKVASGTPESDFVCLTSGTSVDVPKHAEKVVSDGCPKGTAGYALREQPFGLGWGVQSHASLPELVADDKADDAALKAAVQAPAAQLTATATPVPPAVIAPEANPVEVDQANADAAPSKPRVNRADLPEMFQ